jgi:hypothetical protein
LIWVHSEATYVAVRRWNNGRIGTFRRTRPTYGSTANGEKGDASSLRGTIRNKSSAGESKRSSCRS